MKSRIELYDNKMLFNVLKDSWKQAESAWKKIDTSGIDTSRIRNIIITGLGGSAISGDLLANFLRDELMVSLSINRTYSMPRFADENTLVIASSYSGNTEETNSAVNDALAKKCTIICITTGGQLADFAARNNLLCVKLQEGFQPRYALYNSFFTLLRLFQGLELVPVQEDSALEIIGMLKSMGSELSSSSNTALEMAGKIQGMIPVIYTASGLNDSVGRRFKGQLNENSKMHAWIAEYPEMNHNEIVGWETAGDGKDRYCVVNIVEASMNRRVSARFEIINNLLKEHKIDILKIEGKSGSFKTRLLECIYFCDWVSYYLAVINEKDPGEIDFIHYLKNKMAGVS
ncbi:MAG TPA: bifunctional phosphoglucose/phosphomannose isomerase [Spirochaetota bacterium]|nr:bifunctional phosphoglucose/phosphomannose isomerase [Spirochaetota bacterium]